MFYTQRVVKADERSLTSIAILDQVKIKTADDNDQTLIGLPMGITMTFTLL
ncbi:hypothetical protein [Enterococcus bulliens]